jgi:hypothetical protein
MQPTHSTTAVMALIDLSCSYRATSSSTSSSSISTTTTTTTTTEIRSSTPLSSTSDEEDEDYGEYSPKRTKKPTTNSNHHTNCTGKNNNNTNSGIQKNRKRKREITKDEIKKYFNYSQAKAAKMLGVSVSTLKRRYYSMGMGKWPYPENKFLAKKRSVSYICLAQDRPEKFMDQTTLQQLYKAFKCTSPDY